MSKTHAGGYKWNDKDDLTGFMTIWWVILNPISGKLHPKIAYRSPIMKQPTRCPQEENRITLGGMIEHCSPILIKSINLLPINTLATRSTLQTPDQALQLSRTIGHTEWARSQRGNLLKKSEIPWNLALHEWLAS